MITPIPPDENDEPLLGILGKLPPIEPPGDQRDRFRQRLLATDAPTVPRGYRRAWLAAAAVALLLGSGWFYDRQTQITEIHRLRDQLALTMQQDVSAATRLLAVRRAGDTAARDQTIIDALTAALLTDPNTNVRAAAAEALGRVAERAVFLQVAAQSVAQDGSPFVHAALLRTAAALNPTDRATLLHVLLARTDLDPVLRREALASLAS